MAPGLSLIQRPTVCGVSEYNRKAKIIRRPWKTRGCCAIEKSTAPVFLTDKLLIRMSDNSSTQFGQFIEYTFSYREANTLPTR
jgi:hypothetical protein